jgi:hypothetical protein
MPGFQADFTETLPLDRQSDNPDTRSKRGCSVSLTPPLVGVTKQVPREPEDIISELSIPPSATVSMILAKAKEEIEAGETHLKRAAESIAVAQKRGVTQREIAEAVAKSPAWVNRLIKWREAGYADTPFGPQSKVSRAKVQARKRKRQRESPQNAKRAAISQRSEVLSEVDFDHGRRKALILGLDRLRLDDERARADAAMSVEIMRNRLGLSWEQLIVTPASADDDVQDYEAHRSPELNRAGDEADNDDGDWV